MEANSDPITIIIIRPLLRSERVDQATTPEEVSSHETEAYELGPHGHLRALTDKSCRGLNLEDFSNYIKQRTSE